MWDDTHVRSRLARIVVVAAAAAALTPSAHAQPDTVLVTRVEGPITPVVADHLTEGVDRAEREGHAAFLVELDTPGGLDTSMREIVKSFFAADVPVVVYIAPPGARGASAGAIIAFAAHVAAMAPGTNIGAATPVDLQGGEIGDKVINDAAAYVEAIATERGRDVDFAVDTVTEGRSAPAEEALELGVIDVIARDRAELLDAIDGLTVELARGEHVIATRGAATVDHELGFFGSLRQTLADPTLAFLFISIGTLAIIYELANPGMGLGGIIGLILLVLGFFALSVLPVNMVGVLFLLLALGLFVAEVFAPGIGVMAAGGAISLVLSALFLVRGPLAVNLAAVIPTVVVVGGGVVFAGRLAWRTRKARTQTGSGAVIGRTAQVRRVTGETAQVFIQGGWWTVRGPDRLEEGQKVRVVGIDGLELVVETEEEEGGA